MRYREYHPGPALAGVVHRFWTLEGTAPASAAPFQRAMPDGRPELIFNLGDAFERCDARGVERQPRALLVGPTTRPMRVRPTGRLDLIGVRLRPGLGPAVLGIPSDEVLDAGLELPLASRQWREDVLEPLAERRPTSARLAVLERRLLGALRRVPGRWAPDRRLLGAVERALLGERIPSARLAEDAGVSTRHLGRIFRTGAGMSPALLVRVARFQRVLRDLERPGRVQWAAVASRHGYSDQAHLCREFRRFGGVAPGRYLIEVRELTRHFVDGAGDTSAPTTSR